MKRPLKSRDQIQAEVARLIQVNEVVRDDGEEVHVSRPVARAPGAEVDGCNWTIAVFGNASAYRPEVARALAIVQAKWNLIA